MIKTKPQEIYEEYRKAVAYNTNIGLYDKVSRNNDFYSGDQWKGVNAPDLEKPVLNFLHRVVTYFISMIVSDDIGVSFTPMKKGPNSDEISRILAKQVEKIIEQSKAKSKNRDMLKDCAVDGDAAFYLYFDPDIETGQDAKGDIEIENIDNTKVLFGNPYIYEVQKQPYIIVVQRAILSEVKAEAAKAGLDPDEIRSDREYDCHQENENTGDELVTVLLKFWKQEQTDEVTGESYQTIHFMKCTGNVVLQEPTNLGLSLYPIAYMSWEKVKNSYHGRSPITELIPNQIFVNKMWAMMMEQAKKLAFPKIIYNRSLIKGWSNKVGEAIAVDGGDINNIATSFRAADMSAQATDIVERTISYSREFMGASDAALGNVRPDNTSAIIAVQKSSSAPLELQRLSFYQFVEDYVRIIVDIICTYYGVRSVYIPAEDGTEQENILDFSQINWKAMQFNVDVGTASYWSELTQIQTADNLFAKGIISDAVTYLESIPDQYIKGKSKVIQKLKEQQEQQEQQMQQMGGGMNGPLPQMLNSPFGQQMPKPQM